MESLIWNLVSMSFKSLSAKYMRCTIIIQKKPMNSEHNHDDVII